MNWRSLSKNARLFAVAAIFVTLCFSPALFQLFNVALDSAIHSHIVLIPLLAGFLLWNQRERLPEAYERSPRGAAAGAGVGLILIGAALFQRGNLSENDYLSFTTAAYLSVIVGIAFWTFGAHWLKSILAPVLFLIFMIPAPDALVHGLETLLVKFTTLSLVPFYTLADIPFVREEAVFHIPGITIEVARECSGIRSTMVLLIVGLLSAYLFLKTNLQRSILIALLIPLGIIRNTFRIFVITLLCVHRGPEMIHSYIHHEGGPLFFVLSLIPLFILIGFLRRFQCTNFKGKEAAAVIPQLAENGSK